MIQSQELPLEQMEFYQLCNKLRNLNQFNTGDKDNRTMLSILQELLRRMAAKGYVINNNTR